MRAEGPLATVKVRSAMKCACLDDETMNHKWTRIHTNDRRTLNPVLHCTQRTNRFRTGFCLSFIRVDSYHYGENLRFLEKIFRIGFGSAASGSPQLKRFPAGKSIPRINQGEHKRSGLTTEATKATENHHHDFPMATSPVPPCSLCSPRLKCFPSLLMFSCHRQKS